MTCIGLYIRVKAGCQGNRGGKASCFQVSGSFILGSLFFCLYQQPNSTLNSLVYNSACLVIVNTLYEYIFKQHKHYRKPIRESLTNLSHSQQANTFTVQQSRAHELQWDMQTLANPDRLRLNGRLFTCSVQSIPLTVPFYKVTLRVEWATKGIHQHLKQALKCQDGAGFTHLPLQVCKGKI